jgi:hypothetical protein
MRCRGVMERDERAEQSIDTSAVGALTFSGDVYPSPVTSHSKWNVL